jgi:hypothetical protein
MHNCDYVKGMKVKVPVQNALAGLAGPHSLPPLLRYAELVRGGGGCCKRAESCLGILSGEGGLLWQVYLAGKNGA